MNKKIIAALVVAAFAAAGVAVAAVNAGRRTLGNADGVTTYESQTAFETKDSAKSSQAPKQTLNDATTEENKTAAPENREPKRSAQNTELTKETKQEIVEPEQTESIWPDESYIGVWYDEYKADSVKILEITDDSIKFEAGIFRTLSVHATAMKKNGEILFGEAVAPCYTYPTNKASGKLIFDKDGVTIIYDDLFEPPLDYMNREDSWRNYKFTIFEELISEDAS